MMKEPKVGDVVHVKATVCTRSDVQKDTVKILISPSSFGAFYVPRDTIVHVEPRPLAVGDKVRCTLLGSEDSRGEIKGVYGNLVWVLFEKAHDPSTWAADAFELDDSK